MTKISIPELNSIGITSAEFLSMLNGMCDLYLEKIAEKYPSVSINDIGGYVRQICSKIVKMSKTLEVVAGQEHDYVVSNCVIRSIADNVASLFFVYNREEEEMIFRHLLFVMDGLDARLQMKLRKPLVKDSHISQEEFDALKQQVEEAIENEKGCIAFCENTIRKLPYYKKHSGCCNTLIEKRNWKYEKIECPKKSISWDRMYSMLDLKGDDIFSYLSQYVHGLSVSNIIVPYNEDDFQPVWTFGVVLIGRLREFMEKFYGISIEDIGIDAEKIFECMPNGYLNKLLKRYSLRAE